MTPDQDTLGARLIRDNDSLSRAHRRKHNKLRRIENEVRKHVFQECDCRDANECMIRLYRLIPISPRPRA